MINSEKKDYTEYNKEEKQLVENTAGLVVLLYKACEVKLVKRRDGKDVINMEEIKKLEKKADVFLDFLG